MNFFKIFFNSMMKALRFETIGHKSFNTLKSHILEGHKVQVWPGFDARLINKEGGILLNIDVCHKVVRQDSVLSFMEQVRSQAEVRGLDPKEELISGLTGLTVVTRYNNKTYRVEKVDFSLTPESTFTKGDEEISFKAYYESRYKETITDMAQPMLIHVDRKTGNQVCLIPELCCLTGLTDNMRSDFRLMKDLSIITHTDAQRKVAECKNLFEVFNSNERCQQKMKEWKLGFREQPVEMTGVKYSAGRMLMGPGMDGQR